MMIAITTHPRHGISTILFSFVATILVCPVVECGIRKMMMEAMMSGWNDGWDTKGITFGIKSKGMTAIIPIPLPIPFFSKDKGGGDKGGGGGKKVKYIPVPVPSGGQEGWW